MNEQILTTVAAVLRRANVLRPGAILLVALSGGADSVALLRAVCTLGARHGFFTRAAHVEHGLRGNASQEDALFCERLCDAMGVPFTLDHAQLGGGMCAPGAETRAREARYALLVARAKACHADALLLAHHLDDQAETVLARLIRGSGARGLSGMREQTVLQGVTLLRPLLSLSKETLLASLDGQPYRTDETNRMPCCQRNRLRANVLPLLATENPQAASHIAQSATLLAMDGACLQAQADVLLQTALIDCPPYLCARRDTLAAAPEAIAVRALRRLVERGFAALSQAERAMAANVALPENTVAASPVASSTENFAINPAANPAANPAINPVVYDASRDFAPEEHAVSASDSLQLLGLLRAPEGATLNLPRGISALAGARFVHLIRMADGSPLSPVPVPPLVTLACRGQSATFGAFTFRFRAFCPATDPAPDGIHAVVLPDDVLARAVFRVPCAGDHIVPFGARGGKVFRRYLTDRKIDPPFRPGLPLLCEGTEVLWVVGIGAAEGTRITQAPSTLVTVEGEPFWVMNTARSSAPIPMENLTNIKE